ncbi:hypothetical protein [Dietzia sp. PP-33]|jgi:hypothetical protein|nr:hypothetical protein [Dietzia sp. PP-33]MDX2356118.1 hypothetical protein [Dietzia sp. PP-33]
MPDFSAIGDLLGGIDDILSGVMGFAGSLAGDGLETVMGSLGEAAE